MQQTKEMSMLLKIGNATVEGEVFLTEEGKSCKDYEATLLIPKSIATGSIDTSETQVKAHVKTCAFFHT